MGSVTTSPFRVAIVGGGIGGLFAALSIYHHCTKHVKIDVYERAAEYKEIGAGVGIGVNAAKLLDKIGLLDEALAIAGTRNKIWLTFRRYDNGEEIITIPAKEQGKIKGVSVARSEFLELLYHAVLERGAAKLHTNKGSQVLEVSVICEWRSPSLLTWLRSEEMRCSSRSKTGPQPQQTLLLDVTGSIRMFGPTTL